MAARKGFCCGAKPVKLSGTAHWVVAVRVALADRAVLVVNECSVPTAKARVAKDSAVMDSPFVASTSKTMNLIGTDVLHWQDLSRTC